MSVVVTQTTGAPTAALPLESSNKCKSKNNHNKQPPVRRKEGGLAKMDLLMWIWGNHDDVDFGNDLTLAYTALHSKQMSL